MSGKNEALKDERAENAIKCVDTVKYGEERIHEIIAGDPMRLLHLNGG